MHNAATQQRTAASRWLVAAIAALGLVAALALCPAPALAAGDSEDAQVTVKYKANGGKLASGTDKSEDVDADTKIKLAKAPTREGYIFEGWLNSVTDKVAKAKSSYTVKEDVTFTAQWEQEEAVAKVKFKKSSGKITKISVKINKDKSNVTGGIKYEAKAKYGSFNKAKNGKWTKKASSGIEAVKMTLTGDLKDKFNVYYRLKVKDYGWMAWTKNGAKTGTGDMSKTLYLIKNVKDLEVKLVSKADSKAIKKIKKANKGLVSFASLNKNLKKFAKVVLTKKAAKAKKSSTKWLIVVDTHLNYTALFKGKKGDWKFYKIYRCVTGKASTPTVKGNFSLGSKGNEFGHGYSCWYWSQIYEDYLFHSQPYYTGSKTSVKYKSMGRNQSHGCVRLYLKDAKFIHDKIPSGTRIYIY